MLRVSRSKTVTKQNYAQCLKIAEKVAFNIAVKVLPDKSLLTGQKLMENAKIGKFKCDICSNFQTL